MLSDFVAQHIWEVVSQYENMTILGWKICLE